MHIVFCGTGWFRIVDFIQARLPEAHIEVRKPGQPVLDAIRTADVILPSNGRVDRGAIMGAERLQLIQQPAAGYDAIDLSAARERGIPVCNAPGTNSASVAETALLLILTGARKINAARRAFDAVQIGGPLGLELFEQRLLIVGKGQSGTRLGRAATGLGMQVTYLDSRSTRQDLLDGLREADVVSLHCPLTDRTRHLLNEEAFSVMKRGAILVNVARGPIVEPAALAAALDRDHLGAFGLDVPHEEPWNPRDPLFSHENVYALPHMATSTHAAFARIADVVAHNVTGLTQKTPLMHRIA